MAEEPTLVEGSTGDPVRRLQRALASVGVDPGPIDGIFGPLTKAAVRTFQSIRGLQVDGIVGPLTWAALPILVVRLHVKVMIVPITQSVDDLIRNMRDTYISARIGVEVGSTETLANDPALVDLDVGACPFPIPTTPTAEQAQLFAHNANVGPNEIAAYFVGTVTSCSTNNITNPPPDLDPTESRPCRLAPCPSGCSQQWAKARELRPRRFLS